MAITRPQQQQGAVLIVSLIILLVMTIAALSSSRSILLQEKMTGTVRESHLAFQAAEAAVADAQDDIENFVTTGGFSDAGNNGLYTATPTANINHSPTNNLYSHALWNDATKYINATTSTSANVPLGKYIIQLVNDDISSTGDSGDVNDLNFTQEYSLQGQGITAFRITARGESRDGKSVTIIQTYYGKRIN